MSTRVGNFAWPTLFRRPVTTKRFPGDVYANCVSPVRFTYPGRQAAADTHTSLAPSSARSYRMQGHCSRTCADPVTHCICTTCSCDTNSFAEAPRLAGRCRADCTSASAHERIPGGQSVQPPAEHPALLLRQGAGTPARRWSPRHAEDDAAAESTQYLGMSHRQLVWKPIPQKLRRF